MDLRLTKFDYKDKLLWNSKSCLTWEEVNPVALTSFNTKSLERIVEDVLFNIVQAKLDTSQFAER